MVKEELTIRIPADVMAVMVENAERDYPRETCGVLVGKQREAILRAIPIPNRAEKSTRYVFDPLVFRDVEREADVRGLSVIGIYHSHPDHPAVPSETDRALAWPDYFYVILAVARGRVTDIRVWRFPERNAAPEPVGLVTP